ncbi:carboxypeptidase regulatory-like domain-containing protein [Streptomyces sp. TRM68367]|uniref:carboxypeptidase regulatory-like domain-containing protein n=1 Tax=Streptomyces sp. TRM68367 TaxID=2758415 RepID=UPI0029341331|nr:carboxypeptidase regulatory-like domain-containing protein [Streptomyces sp. TRM68367]
MALAGVLAPSGAAAPARPIRGEATIAPGREGIVEVSGYGTRLGAGATVTLRAPAGAEVTGVPLDAPGYRGSLAADGRRGTYTVTGTPRERRAFPFVLAVPEGAVPGTRLRGCAVRVVDAGGAVRAAGACAVTVGLPGPTLTRPESGVPLPARPEIAGTAHPGVRITVRDKDHKVACAATTGADGIWRCTPDTALPTGANRLQPTASLNGVSAVGEQIQITVTDGGAAQRHA